jgi:DnaJ-class molecular chaperone
MRDPYRVLGVARDAGASDIHKAFRALARQMHPDSDPGNPWAEEEFKELSAAYDLLSDAGKRDAFDRGEVDAAGIPRGRGRARRGGRAGPLKVRGANVSYALDVDFLEAALGVTRRVAMANAKRLNVRVPPGTKDGQTLRLEGQGMVGVGGGGAGDALVEISVKPDPLFSRRGNDVLIDVPVTLQEAVLGAPIEVPTIDGTVSVTVPEGSNTGTVLRLRGKGIKRPSGSRGNQLVTLKVVLPGKKDRAFSDFVKRWGPKNPYTVRRDPLKTSA